MPLRKKIPLQVYDCEVEFEVSEQIIKRYDVLNKKYKLGEGYEALAGVFIKAGNMKKYHIIVDSDSLTHNTIAHEIYHGSTQICADRAVEEEEARAWLTGYITEEIYKFLEKKKQPIKHG